MSLVRQIVFSTTDELDRPSVTGEYSWDLVADGNGDEKLISCCYIPRAKDAVITISVPNVFLGTLGADEIIESFRPDLSLDDGSPIMASAITNPLILTDEEAEPYEVCRYLHLETNTINGLKKGLDVKYSIDAETPHRVSPTWYDTHYTADKTRAYFPKGIARWIHLQLTDDTIETGREMFGPFSIEFYAIGSRDGESTKRA
jgi:hypothetical protein